MTTTESNKLIAEFMGMPKQIIKDGRSGHKQLVFGLGVESDLAQKFHIGEYSTKSFVDDGDNIYYALFCTELEYHSSWDWLMPVVEKIESIKTEEGGYSVQIEDNECIIFTSQHQRELGHGLIEYNTPQAKLMATYKAVVEFIKWYNENK